MNEHILGHLADLNFSRHIERGSALRIVDDLVNILTRLLQIFLLAFDFMLQGS